MFIVLGASGHVGSSVVSSLLRSAQPVTAVVRDEAKAAAWRAKGAQAAVVDINDSERLRNVFKTGTRAFLLNPPAPVSGDTDAIEQRSRRSIVNALDGSGLKKVVLESTYGAQPGDRIGDLSVLFDFEQALAQQPIPATVLRAAYYMSNWDALLPAAEKGSLPTMLPADLRIPMVAPADIGRMAADLMQAPIERRGIHYVESPERYSPREVAAAFSQLLGKPVELAVTPRAEWEAAYRQQGFSADAAASYARMTAVSVDSGFEMTETPQRGHVTLAAYIAQLVRTTPQ